MNYCHICHFLSEGTAFNRDIVAICRENNKPVCAKHAKCCVDDGHGTAPLPIDIRTDKFPDLEKQ